MRSPVSASRRPRTLQQRAETVWSDAAVQRSERILDGGELHLVRVCKSMPILKEKC